MKKALSLILCILTVFTFAVPSFALSIHEAALSATEQAVIETVENWLYDNYGDFYDIKSN